MKSTAMNFLMSITCHQTPGNDSVAAEMEKEERGLILSSRKRFVAIRRREHSKGKTSKKKKKTTTLRDVVNTPPPIFITLHTPSLNAHGIVRALLGSCLVVE